MGQSSSVLGWAPPIGPWKWIGWHWAARLLNSRCPTRTCQRPRVHRPIWGCRWTDSGHRCVCLVHAPRRRRSDSTTRVAQSRPEPLVTPGHYGHCLVQVSAARGFGGPEWERHCGWDAWATTDPRHPEKLWVGGGAHRLSPPAGAPGERLRDAGRARREDAAIRFGHAQGRVGPTGSPPPACFGRDRPRARTGLSAPSGSAPRQMWTGPNSCRRRHASVAAYDVVDHGRRRRERRSESGRAGAPFGDDRAPPGAAEMIDERGRTSSRLAPRLRPPIASMEALAGP